MDVLVFDIETNEIKDFDTLLGLKTIHCIALAKPGDTPELVPVEEALERLRLADVIVGHNIQKFDIPAIQRLYPDWRPMGCVRDTLIMSRMLWPDISTEDWQAIDFPKKLVGRQSLEAWGVRLGIHKGDFGKTCDWSEYTDEMGEYCIQDVRVTQALWQRIEDADPPEKSTILEHEFAAIVDQQEKNGFAFNVDAARKLHGELLTEKNSIEEELKDLFPPKVIEMKTPEYYYDDMSKIRYTTKSDAPHSIRPVLSKGPMKKKVIPFNPSSRVQIAEGLIKKYDWKPTEFTPEGRPKVDEKVLSSLSYPEAQTMVRYLTVSKRLGQISDGKESWLNLEKEGRIHGRVNSCGAVTGRCTHSRPNIAQVPRVTAPWGRECRSLFTVPKGWKLVGADMSGLELRCLAHYTFPFDGGKYVKAILEGDVHTDNMEASGLETRDQAKTFIYAFLYGAGDAKIGQIVGGSMAEGRNIKKKFLAKMPAIKTIQNGINHVLDSQRSYLIGVDGRKLRIRSKHSALNTLLQSAGAVAMKEATCILNRKIRAKRWCYDAFQVAHIHDEIQLQVREEIAEDVGRLAVQSMREAGDSLGFRCPLDGEYRVGTNWAETH
jgi:DNA polymerase-1